MAEVRLSGLGDEEYLTGARARRGRSVAAAERGCSRAFGPGESGCSVGDRAIRPASTPYSPPTGCTLARRAPLRRCPRRVPPERGVRPGGAAAGVRRRAGRRRLCRARRGARSGADRAVRAVGAEGRRLTPGPRREPLQRQERGQRHQVRVERDAERDEGHEVEAVQADHHAPRAPAPAQEQQHRAGQLDEHRGPLERDQHPRHLQRPGAPSVPRRTTARA